ncbi:MAG: class I SAM-dependent methyltransferase [Gammaproteobacteria bacterium]|nr:class I SAM-dependent methyltransferase [Gammaproteobacteria bacterium]
MQANIPAQARHGALPKPSHDEAARQEFVRSFKEYLVKHVHPGNRLVYERKVKPQFESSNGRAPRDRFEVRDVMTGEPYYRMFSTLLRTSQEMMWSSCQLPVQRNLGKLIKRARKHANGNGGTLELDPALAIPKYHTAVDIHCQPGGYHTEYTADDVAQGAIYDRGVHVYAMGQMGPYNSDMGDSVIAWLEAHHPALEPSRILDMGCSVGHSTVPYTRAFPKAQVHAIDVAAPMLRHAHARARALGASIHFSQQNAERTNFPDGHFDLIVSHILLHETSQKAIRAIMKECHRLLRPGGLMVHAETPPYAGMDAFDAFMLDWDTRNNNEPFWARSHEIDLKKLAAGAGFDPANAFETFAPSAFQQARARRSHVFQGGDFGGGGSWFLFGAAKPGRS